MSANSSTIDPFTEPAPEDGRSPLPAEAEALVVGFGVGLSTAAEDEGTGSVEPRADGSAVGPGGPGSKKAHAESKQMMLVPPKKIAPILDFPRVPMGPVCQATPRLSGVERRKCRGSFSVAFPGAPYQFQTGHEDAKRGFPLRYFRVIPPVGPAAMWAIEPLPNSA